MGAMPMDPDLSLLTNPLVTSQQLLRFRAANTPENETSIRFATYILTQAAGILLRLPQDVIATALILLQRYQVGSLGSSDQSNIRPDSSREHSPRLLSAAALFLAAKNSFTPVGARSIINVYAYLLSEQASPLQFIKVGKDQCPNQCPDQDQNRDPDPSTYYVSEGTYEREKMKIFHYEASLLAGIGYDVHTALPYSLALTYMGVLGVHANTTSRKTPQDLPARVLQHLNGALLSPQFLYLTHQPNVIAVAAIYLAAREVGVKLAESVNWWEVFDVDREGLGFVVLAMSSLKAFAESEKDRWTKDGPLQLGKLDETIINANTPRSA